MNEIYQYFKSTIDDENNIYRFNRLSNNLDYWNNDKSAWTESGMSELGIDPNNDPARSFNRIDMNDLFLEMV